jgi:hypothetical protein
MMTMVWQRHRDTYCALTPVGTAIVYPAAERKAFYWEVFTGGNDSEFGLESDVGTARICASAFVLATMMQRFMT